MVNDRFTVFRHLPAKETDLVQVRRVDDGELDGPPCALGQAVRVKQVPLDEALPGEDVETGVVL